MYRMRKAGVAIVDLADFYWLSPKSVSSIISKMQKEFGRIKRTKKISIEDAKAKVLDTEFNEQLERHERYLADTIVTVCHMLDAPAQHMLSNIRGRMDIARVRQVCMYILHTETGLSLTQVGSLMGRDRSTISHACHVVEDMRDEVEFDDSCTEIAAAVVAKLKENHNFVSPYELYFAR